MKKPNIKEGEWKVSKPFFLGEELNARILNVSVGEDNFCEVIGKGFKENAQAISAVPEMMNALVDSYYALKGYEVIIKSELGGEGLTELMDIQKQALLKAGVEL